MTFNAKKINEYLKDPETLRFSFNTASAKETKALGAAFSIVVRAMQGKSREMKKAMRIGLSSFVGGGKSTLVSAMTREFGDRDFIESEIDDEDDFHIIFQNTWHFRDLGHIRHYDTRARVRLESYTNNKSTQFGFPLIDIVEHPHYDKNNKEFDCLVNIENQPFKLSDMFHLFSRKKNITMLLTPDIAASSEFSDFLKQAEQYRVPEQDNIPPKQQINAPNGFPAVKPI